MTAARMRPQRRAVVPVVLAYAALCGVWSTTWLGIKIGLDGAPPLTGAGLRFLLAGGLFAVYRLASGQPLRMPADRRGYVVLTALSLFGAPYALVYLGETEITSGLAAVLFGSMPLFSALIADRLLPDEPLTAVKVAGIAIGICGLVVVFHGALALKAEPLAIFAMIGVLLAPAFSAFGQVIGKRETGTLPITLLLAWAMALGGALLLAAGLVFEPRHVALDAKTLGSIVYLAFAGSVLGFAVLFWLLGRIGAVSASFLNLILPLLALVEGWALYGEPLNLSLGLGALVVVTGIGLASLSSLRARRSSSEQVPERDLPSAVLRLR